METNPYFHGLFARSLSSRSTKYLAFLSFLFSGFASMFETVGLVATFHTSLALFAWGETVSPWWLLFLVWILFVPAFYRFGERAVDSVLEHRYLGESEIPF